MFQARNKIYPVMQVNRRFRPRRFVIKGNVEKVRQRGSQPFVMFTYPCGASVRKNTCGLARQVSVSHWAWGLLEGGGGGTGLFMWAVLGAEAYGKRM